MADAVIVTREQVIRDVEDELRPWRLTLDEFIDRALCDELHDERLRDLWLMTRTAMVFARDDDVEVGQRVPTANFLAGVIPDSDFGVDDDDVHPEAFCDQCGRPNIMGWFSPEWNDLVERDQRERLILCPVCFAALDPGAVWKLTRA